MTLELWAGRPKAAAELASDCLDRVSDRESLFFTAPLYDLGARACADLAARAPGNQQARKQQAARAQQLLERLERVIGELTGVVAPLVRASRAGLVAEQSRIGHAGDASLWAEAARQWEACGNRYRAAYTQWRGAETLLGASGHRAGAVAQLQRLELTPREIEVLALLGDGLTNREIGGELFISDKTASVHVSRILSKLAVPNRAAAAAAAQRLGVTRDHMPSTN
ncbi:MAG: response regulator transcription factor [Actinobacteria bacterium]|nr:MAG: response regulator transcription factor [Actinomycetota bacterium]